MLPHHIVSLMSLKLVLQISLNNLNLVAFRLNLALIKMPCIGIWYAYCLTKGAIGLLELEIDNVLPCKVG
jgi:hypothetical protein